MTLMTHLGPRVLVTLLREPEGGVERAFEITRSSGIQKDVQRTAKFQLYLPIYFSLPINLRWM